jgi:prepilin-type N-terminal cleavage/methylation domain-containing protein
MAFDDDSKKLQIANCKLQIANSRSSMLHAPCSLLPRHAMTLIELLVVIVILTTVVAAAIPIMSPSNDDRRLREATRGLNTFITGAQARAIGTGRPYGIVLKRLSADTGRSLPITPSNPDNDNGVCLEVFYVEEQPPFTGFNQDSCVCLSINPNTGLVTIRFITRGNTPNDGLPPGWDADLFPPNTIRVGDVIEIGDTRFLLTNEPNQDQVPGVMFALTTQQRGEKGNEFFNPRNPIGITPPALTGRPINDTGQLINPIYDNRGNELGATGGVGGGPLQPYWTAPLPYKILRQGTVTSDEPFQLPEGTAIDLRASGVGSDQFFYYPAGNGVTFQSVVDNLDPIVIMFTPEGRVARVTFSRTPTGTSAGLLGGRYDQSVVDNVFLLVGKRENIAAPPLNNDPTLRGGAPLTTASTDEQRQDLKEPINWLSGNSRWVVLGSQSGRIVTVENAFVDPLAVLNTYTSQPYNVAVSSEPLRNEQILAAREFTREMSQLGGR